MNVPELLRDPYPGLRSFNRNETHLFFGRESVVNVMVDRLAAHRFLGVIGASGSGKSSLVRTGLLDALERGLMADAVSEWLIADLRPGNHPLFTLAEAVIVATEAARSENDVLPREAMLARGPYGLVEWLRELNLSPRTNLLLLIDQFEEIFRFRRGEERDEVAAFVALLLASAAQREQRIYVVLTMRSDFIGDCAGFPGLAEAINNGQFLTPRLTREQCRQAIEGPASVCGGTIESALVNRLLNDMGTNPDQLPLMQHALMRLWNLARERSPQNPAGRTGPVLMLDDYERMGGLGVPAGILQSMDLAVGDPAVAARFRGALSGHADEILAELSDEQRHIAEILFRALTEGEGVGGRDVRRPASLAEMAAIAGVVPETLYPVIDAFRAAGRNLLMPPPQVPLTPETIVDISHESLIRQWATLREWVREESEAAATYRRLEATAKLWRQKRAELWRRRDLDQAPWRDANRRNAAWAARYGDSFELAMQFFDESLRAERRREASTQLTARRQSRTRYILVGVLGAATIAIIATVVLYDARQVALQNLATAEQNFHTAITANLETTELFLSEYDQGKFPDPAAAEDFLREPAQLLYPRPSESDDDAVDHARLHLFAALSKINLADQRPKATLALACAERDIAARRASLHPSDNEQQRDLADSYSRVGDALQISVSRANMRAEALDAYRHGRDIVEAIAARLTTGAGGAPPLEDDRKIFRPCAGAGDPWPFIFCSDGAKPPACTYDSQTAEPPLTADDFKQDSAIAHENIGDMLRAANRLPEATRNFQTEVDLANAALGPDPRAPNPVNHNAGWWRNLALGLEGLGDIEWEQGDHAAAIDKFRQYQAKAEGLAGSDPLNGTWQRDLAISHQRLGDALRATHDLTGALDHFRACSATKVNAYDERNNWPRDVQKYCLLWAAQVEKEVADQSGSKPNPG